MTDGEVGSFMLTHYEYGVIRTRKDSLSYCTFRHGNFPSCAKRRQERLFTKWYDNQMHFAPYGYNASYARLLLMQNGKRTSTGNNQDRGYRYKCWRPNVKLR